MLTDLILGIMIICNILLFMFCIALCFWKSPHWIEMEYIVRILSGLITAIWSYEVSQMLINSTVTTYGLNGALADRALADFFFWIIGGSMVLYMLFMVVLYILEKIEYATRKVKATVSQMAKDDFKEGLLDADRD
jgi:hypothetical protein